jgi:hypothetical protein
MNWRRLAVPAVIVGSLLLANCGRPVENQQAPPSAALPEDVKLNNSMPLATYRKQLVEEAVLRKLCKSPDPVCLA